MVCRGQGIFGNGTLSAEFCCEPRVCYSFSHVQLFATPWTVAHQATVSMGFSREEYWSGLPSPPPGDLPNPGIEAGSPALKADSSPLSHRGTPIADIDLVTMLLFPIRI